jgi:hypothetical protein
MKTGSARTPDEVVPWCGSAMATLGVCLCNEVVEVVCLIVRTVEERMWEKSA